MPNLLLIGRKTKETVGKLSGIKQGLAGTTG